MSLLLLYLIVPDYKEKILFFMKFFILYCFFCFPIYSENAKSRLNEIKKKIKNNEIIEKQLKKKQDKIDTDIKKIEGLLKNNENKIRIYLSEKKMVQEKINEKLKLKGEIEKNLSDIRKVKEDIIEVLLIENFDKKEYSESKPILASIFKNARNKFNMNKSELDKINKLIQQFKFSLSEIDIKLSDISNNLLEKTSLETSLQGENIITMIQRREKELEIREIGKEAMELKKLLESLKNKSKKQSTKKKFRISNLNKLEDILPIKLKNIEKMTTDRAKKGIVLTLKNKSVLTTPNDGLVVYADAFKGYGNMIILDLGNNYHIIYSGLTSIMCSVGDWINAGKVLGEIELEYKKNEVYLEVRFKGKTINPANWIKS